MRFVVGVFGIGGSLLSGYLVNLQGVNDKRWYLWIPCLGVSWAFPLYLRSLYIDSKDIGLVLFFFTNLCLSFYLGPTVAIAHYLIRPQVRAMTSVILFLVVNVIGLGMGPLVTEMVSDMLSTAYTVDSLRCGLMIGSLTLLVSAAVYLITFWNLKFEIQHTNDQIWKII